MADIPSNSKPDENFKSNNNVQNKNFLFFGNNNNKSPNNPPIQQQTVTKPPPTRCRNELGHPTFAMMTSFQIHNTFHSVHNNEEDNEASEAKTDSDRRGKKTINRKNKIEKKIQVKNSEVTARAPVTISVAETTARPEETSSKKTTKIKWTYNGVRIVFPKRKGL